MRRQGLAPPARHTNTCGSSCESADASSRPRSCAARSSIHRHDAARIHRVAFDSESSGSPRPKREATVSGKSSVTKAAACWISSRSLSCGAAPLETRTRSQPGESRRRSPERLPAQTCGYRSQAVDTRSMHSKHTSGRPRRLAVAAGKRQGVIGCHPAVATAPVQNVFAAGEVGTGPRHSVCERVGPLT